MSAEEELKAYREEQKEKEKQDLRLARITATKFGILAVVALIALVYQFFQQTQANKARILAEQIVSETRGNLGKSELKLKQCKEEMESFSKSLEACRTK